MKKRQKETLIIFLIFSALAASFYLWSLEEIHTAKDPDSKKEVIFLIERGEGAKEISLNLKKEGLIKYSFFFRAYVLIKKFDGSLKAGNYLLSDNMTISEIAGKFVSGGIIKKNISIIEGWSLASIAKSLEAERIMKVDDFYEVTGNPSSGDTRKATDFSQEFDFLKDKPRDLSLEGYLYPDTYEVLPNEDVKEIVKKMLDNFDKKLTPELKKEIETQGKTVFQIITMASLLEKEARTLEDKKIISGILWKRLKIGMPLQVDATINYIKEEDTRVLIEETKMNSPYNTYLNKGLPKGPISNPSMDSILAAIYPKSNPYLYYLSASGTGQMIYSATFAEHVAAKARYRRR